MGVGAVHGHQAGDTLLAACADARDPSIPKSIEAAEALLDDAAHPDEPQMSRKAAALGYEVIAALKAAGITAQPDDTRPLDHGSP